MDIKSRKIEVIRQDLSELLLDFSQDESVIKGAWAGEERYRFMVEYSVDMLYLHDLQGNLLEVNQAAVINTGYSRNELLNMSVFDLHPDETGKESILNRWRDCRRNQSNMVESVHVRKNGQEFPVEVCFRKVCFGGTDYILATVRNISERLKVKQERDEHQSRLAQAKKLETVAMLAGGIAHEFNNLLQSIRGNTHLLLGTKEHDHPDVIRLKSIENNIDRASRLTQQMLIFSRDAKAQKQPVNLNDIVNEAVKILRNTGSRISRINIELCLEKDILLINADPAQVELAILNLCSNAVDAMSSGGTLLIKTVNKKSDQEQVSKQGLTLSGDHVLLSISDTGCGISPDIQKNLYDPFFTTKEPGQGTGLGLFSVYGIVKEHDGSIQCDSKPGKGTRFTIKWPATVSMAGYGGSEPEHSISNSAAKTILIVEDDPDIRELIMETLQSSGYRIMTASNGHEALKTYTGSINAIDMVIMDLAMPVMDSYQCLRKLKNIDPGVRVLIASGFVAPDKAEQILENGASGFIFKPFQLESLLIKIREILDHNNC